MKRIMVTAAGVVLGVSLLSGCVVRSYKVVKDRVDQDLSVGNRGFLKGDAAEPADRKLTRTTRVIEVEFYSPVKVEKEPLARPRDSFMDSSDQDQGWGNRGYISGTPVEEGEEFSTRKKAKSPRQAETPAEAGLQPYVVQKGDTLQKISAKFYGTTKRWKKIYDANTDVLKGPDKIYPGQTINIPREGMIAEAPGKLK